MRRFLAFLLRNWPLKLGAVLLASLLYGGIVLSQDDRRWLGRVVIEPVGLPADATLLDAIPEVTSITYRADLDVALTNESFRAVVDLSRIEPELGAPEVDVPVSLDALDSRVRVVGFEPRSVPVRLDPVVSEEMQVHVDIGPPPEGLQIGTSQARPARVTVEGASTRVESIRTIEAPVTIDASGLSVDQDVELVPLDVERNEVQGVRITPERVRVMVAVAPALSTVTVAVHPDVQGSPPTGYSFTGVTSRPAAVNVNGSEPVVELLQTAETATIRLEGHTESFEVEVDLALPAGLTPVGRTSVTVRVEIEAKRGTQTYQVGVVPQGARPDLVYTLSAPAVLVTLGGMEPDLAAIDPSELVAVVDVAELGPGDHDVEIELVESGPGRLVSVVPASIGVVVAVPPSPTPSAVAPTPSPTALP